MADGIGQGHRDELVGGGLRRSSQFAEAEEHVCRFDQRVLGSGDFVGRILQRAEPAPAAAKLSLAELAGRVVQHFGLPAELLRQRKRSRLVAEARSVLCYFAVREMGISGEEVGRMLNISRAAVSFAAARGEILVAAEPSLRETFLTPEVLW